jgi:predicted dehydrogenase (TIGR03970 family)
VYDVVIVGAGSAGCALAARLSDNAARTVLLLEAGVEATAESLSASTMVAASAGRSDNWTFESQGGHALVRGKVIGGSSAINAGLFVRATVEDCDGWAASGNPLWSHDALLPFWQRLEADADFGDRPGHGAAGPVPVSRRNPAALHPFSAAFVESCGDAGWVAHDMNAPGADGVGRLPLNIVGGQRVSAADAYLTPLSGRTNLTIRGGCFVHRVVINDGRARAVDVEVDGAMERVEGAEVVLCAGAVKSAHLLMLSGVGPAQRLRAVGLDMVVDLPGVGTRFSDHPQVFVSAEPRGNLSTHPVSAEVGLNDALLHGAVNLIAYVNPMGVMVPGSGASLRRLTLGAVVCGARSRGTVTVASADPHQPPVIDHGYNAEPADVALTQAAGDLVMSHLRSPAMRSLLAPGIEPSVEYGTAMHTCSTAPMGPDSDAMAVVDQYCRVRGVDNLRVVDTSVLPSAPSRGPAATAVLIGERASAFFDAS